MNVKLCSLIMGLAVLPTLANGDVINTVFLGGYPFIDCGTERTFSVTVTGNWPTEGGDLYMQAFDSDPISPHDPLSSVLYFAIPGSYHDVGRFTFVIGCTPFPDCRIYGLDSNQNRLFSGESTAELYVKVTFEGGGEPEVKYSPTVQIECVPSPGALSLALAGGLIVARRRRVN